MRRLVWLIIMQVSLTVTLWSQADNDILMTVGSADVTVEEFRYIYEKNNGEEADYSKASLDEYLALYKKFKLKVQEAKAMKLDTIAALKEELAGYRKQLASSFLADKEVLGSVVDEIHERKKTDIELQHILIKVKPTAADKKKAAAELRINQILSEYRKGADFSTLASKYSEDKNTLRKGGNLGFTTAMLPSGFYELENVLYDGKVGEVYGPVWTKLGCHLVKVKSKRPSRGAVKVAHILIKPDKAVPAAQKRAKVEAQEIYDALLKGGDWSNLVMQKSDDTKTKASGGELPMFGISTYERSFEDAAFELTSVGDISAPIETSSGYHIIKLVEKVLPETKDEIKKRIEDKIKNYDRYKAIEANLIQRIKTEAGYKTNQKALDSYAASLTKDFYSYRWKIGEPDNTELFTLGSDSYSIADFTQYAKKNTRLRSKFDKEKPVPEAVKELYEEYVREQAITYEEDSLEKKYPSFRSLMREYEEGILLFEATKIAVWDRANQDSIGLQKFHEQNKDRYKYKQRAVVGLYTINSKDSKILGKVKKCAAKHSSEKTLRRFNKGENSLVEYTQRTVDLNDPLLKGLELKAGSTSSVEQQQDGDVSTFRKIVNLEQPRTKTLKEARGYIVADYQDKLESEWVDKLQKSYPVNVNSAIYQQLVK